MKHTFLKLWPLENEPAIRSRSRLRSLAGGVAFAACACAATGCYATVDPAPVGYAEVTSAPVDIETYPSVTYMGEPVYFYGDHWWHRDGGRWAYFKSEPEELYRQRAIVRRAPRTRARVPQAEVRVHEDHR
jgi:hypothetical protein